MRECSKCGVSKPPEEFYSDRGRRRSDCGACVRAYKAAHYAANREKYRAKESARRLARSPEENAALIAHSAAYYLAHPEKYKAYRLRKYGLTLEQYRAQVEAQGGKCAICALPADPLCVDHNHATGQIRDLLCGSCNRGIGKFRENPEAMERAAAYVRRWNPLV